MDYFGKYKQSRKAVELQLLSDISPYLPINPNQRRVLTIDPYMSTNQPNFYHSPTSAQQHSSQFSHPYGNYNTAMSSNN